MKNLFSFIVISFMLSTTLLAQKNTIVTIDGRPISTEEFETIYNKNNTNLNDVTDVKSPQEYMKMFIDFKLKVIEAENRGLDTTQAFKKELAEYRSELAKSYLTDVTVTDSMIKETYFRSVNLVKVSHILLSLSEDASPEDTLNTYNKLNEIRNKYLNHEKTFSELAAEYSDDKSKDPGSLPYFSAFKMIKPFEDVAYTTKIGDVSMPFRTQFGYHIIKVEDLKPSKGNVKVAHIMKAFSNANDVSVEEEKSDKAIIDSVYALIQNGADYGKLAREISDDKQTAKNDGVMHFISEEFAIKEFTDEAFNLKNTGDYSKPFRTKYGWHIIKRIDFRPVQSLEEMRSKLTQKLETDPLRSKQSKIDFFVKMKKECGFESYDENFKKFVDIVQAIESDTILELPVDCANLVLTKFAGREYTVRDYFNTIKKQNNIAYVLKQIFVVGYDEYMEKIILDYEDSRLEEKYPNFKYLIKEYHDGILLFSIMETEVWNKAVEDSLGLVKFYEQNKGKYQYGLNFDGLLITCDDEDSRKIIEKSIAEGILNPDTLMKIANTDSDKKNKVVKGRWEKGSNRQIDYLVWKGEKPENLNENLQFVSGTIKDGGIKTLDEARGLYISDYQTEIEKEWLKQLHKKYVIKVNEPLLSKVKSLTTKK